MMGNSSDKRWLARQISLALMAGAISMVPQTAHGMPRGEQNLAGSAAVARTGANMTITSAAQNNVIQWQDFSVATGETVAFTDNKNYMNLVAGKGTSFIDGTVTAGGGDIYLVNPHGVIFGKGSSVDVGAGDLYVSTQDTAALAANVANWNGTNPLTPNKGQSDVVNLGGTLKANSVIVEGNNIRFTNTADVTVAPGGTVNLNANMDSANTAAGNGYVHIGYEATDYGTADPATDIDSPMAKGWKVNGATATAANAYMRVNTAEDLKKISANPAGNYMMTADIDLQGSPTNVFIPIANFSGNFDGNFYTISNLYARGTGNVGLFADASNGRIENVGLVNNNVFAATAVNYAGGIVGQATNETIQNVYSTGAVAAMSAENTGGIVGSAINTNVRRVYNTGSVGGGGIVGTAFSGTRIEDVYNTGSATYGILAHVNTSASSKIHIRRIYTYGHSSVNGKWKSFLQMFIDQSNSATWLESPAASNYSAFKTAFGDAISNEGGTDTPWRMKEGMEYPALTPFYKGTVAVSYDYEMGTGSLGHSGTSYGTNPAEVYNKQNIVLKNITYSGNDSSAITMPLGSGDLTLWDTGKNEVNATNNTDPEQPYVLFQSDKYDLVGGNFTIRKREIIANVSGGMQLEKEYDGNANVNYAGTITTSDIPASGDSGIMPGDSVALTGSITGTYYSSEQAYDAAKALSGPAQTAALEAAQSPTVGKNKFAVVDFQSASLTNKNYKLSISGGAQMKSNNGIITPRSIKITGPTAGPSKVYDGTTNLPAGWTGALTTDIDSRRIAGNDVNFSSAGAAPAYTSANAGTQDFAYTGLSLTGADKDNYKLVTNTGDIVFASHPEFAPTANGTYTLTGTITPRPIDKTAFQELLTNGNLRPAAETKKVYDGTAAYTQADGLTGQVSAPQAASTGVVAADRGRLRFTVASAVFNDPNATANSGATRVDYTVNISAADPALLANYTLDLGAGANTLNNYTGAPVAVSGGGQIDRRVLTIGMKQAGIDKVYDGDADVKDPTNKGYLTFGGGYVGYGTNSPQVIPADAGAAQFGVTAAYKGTNGEGAADVNRAADWSVRDKNILYTVSLTGAKAGNYILRNAPTDASTGQSTTLNAAGKITPQQVTLTAANILQKTYDGTTDAYANGGWAASMTQNDPGWALKGKGGAPISGVTVMHGAARFNSENVRQATTVTFTNVKTDSPNYNIVGSDGNPANLATVAVNGKINPKPLNVNGNITAAIHDAQAIQKVYDGKKAIDPSIATNTGIISFALNGLVAKDQGKVTVTATGADFDNKNAGTGKTVTYHLNLATATGDPELVYNYAFSGGSLNGSVDKVVATNGEITKRTLYAAVTGTESKVYDSTTAVVNRQGVLSLDMTKPAQNQPVTSEGALAPDDVQLDTAGLTMAYDSANAGTGRRVTYGGLALTGADANNYQLASTSVVGAANSTIAKRGVRVAFKAGLNTGIDKIYDGNRNLVDDGMKLWSNPGYNLELTADAADPTHTGLVGGQNPALTVANKGYADENVNWNAGTSQADPMNVTYAGFSLNDNNYYIINAGDTLIGTGTIKPKEITANDVEAKGKVEKIYDTTTVFAPAGAIAGSVQGGKVTLNSGAAATDIDQLVGFKAGAAPGAGLTLNVQKVAFRDANVVNNQGAGQVDVTVDVTGAGNSHNYKFTGGSTVTKTFTIGTIKPANITVDFAKVTKKYDGTTNVPASLINPTLTGKLGSDAVALSGGYTAAFQSANADADNGTNWVNYGDSPSIIRIISWWMARER